MSQILATRTSADFRIRRVRVRKEEGSNYDITPSGGEISFEEMMQKRKQINIGEMCKDMDREGHQFANIGVASYLTLSIAGDDYLLGTRRLQEEFGDLVFGVIGGYVEEKHLTSPLSALEKEISEELLPVTSEGKLIRFSKDEYDLERPFSDKFEDYHRTINLNQGSRYKSEGLSRLVSIEGAPIQESPGVFFESTRNCAMLMFDYPLDTGDLDLQQLGVSLHFSEDSFNPEKKLVETKFNPLDILLIRLRDGKLTEQIYLMEKGYLKPTRDLTPDSFYLCEAYRVEDAFTTDSEILFREVLER